MDTKNRSERFKIFAGQLGLHIDTLKIQDIPNCAIDLDRGVCELSRQMKRKAPVGQQIANPSNRTGEHNRLPVIFGSQIQGITCCLFGHSEPGDSEPPCSFYLVPAKCQTQIFNANTVYVDAIRFECPEAFCRPLSTAKIPIFLSFRIGFKQNIDICQADMLQFHIFKQQRQQPDLHLQLLNFKHLRLGAPGRIGQSYICDYQRRQKTNC